METDQLLSLEQGQAIAELCSAVEHCGGARRSDVLHELLWRAIRAFEAYPLQTTAGLPFTYSFKPNRSGTKGNEMLVSRKAKTITRSSAERALDAVLERNEPLPVRMSTPKELGVFGASYLYPVFIRLGLIEHIGGHRRGGRRKKT